MHMAMSSLAIINQHTAKKNNINVPFRGEV
jgi:hypothetical protein